MDIKLPNIFEYTNYREYLKDFYEAKKLKNSNFSYQLFATHTGFKSRSFIKLVIDGKKNLSPESADKFNSVLKLSEKSFSYFKDLVAFNQSTEIEVRNFYFDKLLSYNKRNPAKVVIKNQYDFYSQWYHNTLRELIPLLDNPEDYEKTGKKLSPPISAKEVRSSIMLLLKLGLLKKTNDGYKQANPIITTGDEVQSLAIQNFHLSNLQLTEQSISQVPSEQRDISCLCLGLSNEGVSKIKQEIKDFRKKILQIASEEESIDHVYHLNFHLFPTGSK